MIEVPIQDGCFAHAPVSVSGQDAPLYGRWLRDFNIDSQNTVVLSHTNLSDVLNYKRLGYKVYAWLFEPPVVHPESYRFVGSHYLEFEGIFTWFRPFLDCSDKFIFVPFGGCWINAPDRRRHPKTKSVSMMISQKQNAPGHLLRYQIYQCLRHQIDVFGKGVHPIPDKIEALGPYRFHIVIENCKEDYWFTEKLIDCVQTYTVPVYWGCPSIDQFFDHRGMLFFETLEDVQRLLPVLTPHLYEDMRPYLEKNFDIAKDYLISDDHIFKYLKMNP